MNKLWVWLAWGLALLIAVGLGTARAGSSGAQTIRVRIDAFTRAGTETAWVPLTAPRPAGRGPVSLRAQGVGTLGYTRTAPVRLLVGTAADLPAASLLEVRVRGAAGAVRIGADHSDLAGPALLPGGVHTLALEYVLAGVPDRLPAVPVLYTILDP